LFATAEQSGMSVRQASEIFQGFDQIWYEAQPELVAEGSH
jgi:hypothetical protein